MQWESQRCKIHQQILISSVEKVVFTTRDDQINIIGMLYKLPMRILSVATISFPWDVLLMGILETFIMSLFTAGRTSWGAH